MTQYADEDVSDLLGKVSLEDEERPLQFNSSATNHKARRKGVNSHLYNKPNRGGRVNKSTNPNHHKQNNDINPPGNESYPKSTLKFQPNLDESHYPQQKYDPMQDDRFQRKKNTETFKPSYKPSDMRIIAAYANTKKYTREITSRDVIAIHGLFCSESDLTIYNNLVEETKSSGDKERDLWQLWHGDTHVIADDKRRWKDTCPTFKMILDSIQNYFDMDIKATRLNWYRDSSEWKPFHHDAAAIKPDKAKTQNFTVACSFGAERDVAFEHATTKTVISMPQPNGSIYTFGKDVNVIWRHGVLQLPPDKYHDQGRISIIAWGAVKQTQM